MTDPHGPSPAATGARRRGSGPLAKENRRMVAGLVVGALVAAFAVVNRDSVEVNWLVTTSETPLIIVIALSFLVGAFLGWLTTTLSRRRRG
jgi:uncharacterized integral membrane protein